MLGRVSPSSQIVTTSIQTRAESTSSVGTERLLNQAELRRLLYSNESTAREFIQEKRNISNEKVWLTFEEFDNISLLKISSSRFDSNQIGHLSSKREYGDMYDNSSNLTEHDVFYKLVKKFPPAESFIAPSADSRTIEEVPFLFDRAEVVPVDGSQENNSSASTELVIAEEASDVVVRLLPNAIISVVAIPIEEWQRGV